MHCCMLTKALLVPAGKQYAIKYIPRGATNKYVAREIINHSIMLHPHIVAFKEVRLKVLASCGLAAILASCCLPEATESWWQPLPAVP